MKLEHILEATNVAEELDDQTLYDIAYDCIDNYEVDRASRSKWEEKNKEWIKLATQVKEDKTFPWPNSANVKYPMLTTAALQFASRAYPALVQGNNPVKVDLVGFDPEGKKADQAARISKHLSYQLLHQMEEWEEDMDKTMMVLPIIGTSFKKTYFCPRRGRNVSEYVSPQDLVINYYAKSVETANRKTQILTYYPNEMIEQMRSGFFRDLEIGEGDGVVDPDIISETTGLDEPMDEYSAHTVLECHTLLDLDEDGYKEPYIVHVHKDTEQVLRIYPRFAAEDVVMNDDGEVAKINSMEYFTGYVFIPNPESDIYGLGFGTLLGPLNETANTLINQLLDAGTLSNTQGGFLGRGFKVKGGHFSFKPGEWKVTQSTGDDLRKNVFPLPVREPSGTLFQLLGMIVDAGQTLSSTKDVMMGESPGQNQPATTTMAVLEQGLKVFTSIHKRIYRAMKKELKKLFKLNALYMNDEEYFRILDYQPVRDIMQQKKQLEQMVMQAQQAGQQIDPQMIQQAEQQIMAMQQNTGQVYRNDYAENLQTADIAPAGDPNMVTQAQKLVKAEALMQTLQLGTVNREEVTYRILEAQEQNNIPALMNIPPPQPDFETQLKMQEFQWKQQYEQEKLRLEEQRVTSEAVKDESQGIYQRVKAESQMRQDNLAELKMELEMVRDSVKQITEAQMERNNATKKVKRNAEGKLEIQQGEG
jgi:chaperonin GroES